MCVYELDPSPLDRRFHNIVDMRIEHAVESTILPSMPLMSYITVIEHYCTTLAHAIKGEFLLRACAI